MEADLNSLMAIRIKRILLVCNNYDSFVLNEDGRIEVQIAQEYAELNLSNPPAIVRTRLQMMHSDLYSQESSSISSLS